MTNPTIFWASLFTVGCHPSDFSESIHRTMWTVASAVPQNPVWR